MHENLRKQYEEARDAGQAALNAGELTVSADHYRQSIEIARQLCDELLIDTAICNHAAVSIEIEEPSDAMAVLRRLLLKNSEPELSFRAAYTLSRGYELQRSPDKALFYARIAYRHASVEGSDRLLSHSHNQLGNLLISQSNFEEAAPEYEKALELTADTPSSSRAVILDNLGYCRTIMGSRKAGFRFLFSSLRMLRKLKAQIYEASTLLSLSYAYLQVDRHREAIRHARRALELSERFEDAICLKYALFLLGEGEKIRGNPLAARYYFQRLQEEHYPDSPEVADLLLFLDVQQLVNLKA